MRVPVTTNAFACEWSLATEDRESPRKPVLSGSALALSSASRFGGALYSDFLAQGLSHFFPTAHLEANGRAASPQAELLCSCQADRTHGDQVMLEWLGQCYTLRRATRPFTEGERRLIQAIGRVLTARYQALFNPDVAAENFHLFRGLPEDRYVSAFLDPAPYVSLETLTSTQDRVADAIEVLRSSALTTYENRRVSTGALLLGRGSPLAQSPGGRALRYSSGLTLIHPFARLCDGVHTVALVNAAGNWIDIVDIERWSESVGVSAVPIPGPSAYKAHCLATLGNDNLCLALTPNGEIKAFARGVQVFSFLNGRWRLTDSEWKYRCLAEAVRDEELVKLILQVALDLSESRRGGLFVILDDARCVKSLLASGDLIDHSEAAEAPDAGAGSKRSVYYLLNGKRTKDLTPAVLRTLAAIDGAIVLDAEGRLLAFGAILRHRQEGQLAVGRIPEGGRSLAALSASHCGRALKISEDGVVSFFAKGRVVWEI